MHSNLIYRKLKWLYFILIISSIDIASKKWVIQHLMLYELRPIIPYFNFFYTHNYGLAFSLFSHKNSWYRWLLVGMTITIVIILLIKLYRTSINYKINQIAYVLLIGGALGNLYDRICYGYVVDFIDFHINNWHFATFNIADSSIFIGTMFIVIGETMHLYDKNIKKKYINKI
ncbi:Lipoprotein signal peptidase [Candidatus Erwinia haradaeae]|uniref:Lipoprotein signal peptidase n=1 Tax=Candidatus Erwinia haradaeae TaxID=1922217 RepID=A0A803FU20_9GAMM|nr:Lipoprotein signal peptidase [Candidatus Erwinia haradaeae]